MSETLEKVVLNDIDCVSLAIGEGIGMIQCRIPSPEAKLLVSSQNIRVLATQR